MSDYSDGSFRRHCEERSDEAIHSFFAQRDGLLRFARNDVDMSEHNFTISRHDLPEVLQSTCPLKIRGRREDRVRAAPAVSRAIAQNKTAHEHTGSAETLRPSLRNGFTAYTISPW